VTAGADHHRLVGLSLEAGEIGPGLGAQPGPPGAEVLKAEDQRVVGEAVAAGEGQFALSARRFDVEAGQVARRPASIVAECSSM
jgi:hypothetical protein